MYRQVKGPSGIAKFLGGPSLVGGGSNEPRSVDLLLARTDPELDTILTLAGAYQGAAIIAQWSQYAGKLRPAGAGCTVR